MRLVVRLILYLALCTVVVSLFSSYYQVQSEKRAQRKDLEKRAEVFGESVSQTVEGILASNAEPRLPSVIARFSNREHLAGIGVYGSDMAPVAATSEMPTYVAEVSTTLTRAISKNEALGTFVRRAGRRFYVYAVPLHVGQSDAGGLVVVYDATYISAHAWQAWRDMSLRLVVQLALIALITGLIFHRQINRPMADTLRWMQDLRHGRVPENQPNADMFQPLAREMQTFAASLATARASAEREAKMRDTADSACWTAERLCVSVRERLNGTRLFVVSNREPYSHVMQGTTIKTVVPASGVVTAIEPILNACDGTWIAHGSGNADRHTVDERDSLRVPPESPRYTLRRVWLTKEEEKGYYLGFSNEGIWPLCHIAHTRPTFRAEDWEQYKRVNEKFADAVLQEMEGVANPVVIVQDYHFALLPAIIKKKRPDAHVGLFWHIPWPNPEAFGICPWQRELLDGMLGADLLGFHIQSHCRNFLETVDRTLESRIEWERFAVNRKEHATLVKPFPISVAFPEEAPERPASAHAEQAELLRTLGVEALYLGVGVDRVDYTKGILERFDGIERLLDKYPGWQGKFTFAQIGAPSRTDIKRYNDFFAEVESEAARINERFQRGKWKPILLLNRHHSHEEVERFYRAADVCVVTSLHDGMNLVAKEFIATRHDDHGTLILSPFTGAARELNDALIVNPYHTEQLADALHFALQMDAGEQRSRMQRMRRQVRQQNIYRWASDLIGSLCDVRVETLAKAQRSA